MGFFFILLTLPFPKGERVRFYFRRESAKRLQLRGARELIREVPPQAGQMDS
jgi:hypothetical protein